MSNSNRHKNKSHPKTTASEPARKGPKNKGMSQRISIIVLVGIIILLIYAPFFRGLYFNEEMSTTFLYSGIIFIVFLIGKLTSKDWKIIKTPLDIAVAVLVLAYLIPIVLGVAATAQYAWDKVLRYFDYFLIYLIARDLIEKRKNTVVLLNTIIVGAIGVCVLGIDAGAGAKLTHAINSFYSAVPGALKLTGGAAKLMTFKFTEGFVEGRVFSTLQYPNVLASFLGAAYILLTGLLMVYNRGIRRFIYGMAAFIVFYTFILTESRGMFLIFPVAFVVLLIALRKKPSIVDAVVSAVGPAMIGVIFASSYNSLINTGNYGLVWLSVLVGAVLTGIYAYFMDYLKEPLMKMGLRAYLIIAGVVVLIAGVVIGVGLTMEKPLVISHSMNEGNKPKMVIRDISRIKPDTKYTLTFDLNSTQQKPGQTTYEVSVFSINSLAKPELLAAIKGGAEKAAKSIDFTTRSDTRSIRISMTNFELGTSASFSKFALKDLSTGTQRRIIVQYAYLPTDTVYKIKDINLKTHNAWQRFIFVQDAFKIIKDNFLFGTGGGGWRALYYKYQSYAYASNEVHNHPVQLWVETGIIGFTTLLFLVGLIFYQFFKTRKGLDEEAGESSTFDTVLLSAIFAAIVSLYAHSIIDFDFSLSAVYIFAWVLTGLIAGLYKTVLKPKDVVKSWINTSAMILAFVMSITLVIAGYNSIYGRLVIAERENFKGQMTADEYQKKFPEYMSIYDRYLSLQPLDEERRGEYINNLIQAFKLMPKESARTYLEKAKKHIDINVQNEPYSDDSLIHAGSFYISWGDLEKGLGYIDKAAEHRRLLEDVYVTKAEMYIRAAEAALDADNEELEIAYLKKVLDIPKQIEEVNKTVIEPISRPKDLDKYVAGAQTILNNRK